MRLFATKGPVHTPNRAAGGPQGAHNTQIGEDLTAQLYCLVIKQGYTSGALDYRGPGDHMRRFFVDFVKAEDVAAIRRARAAAGAEQVKIGHIGENRQNSRLSPSPPGGEHCPNSGNPSTDASDRRRAVRHDFNRYAQINSDLLGQQRCLVANVSEGGARLCSDRELPAEFTLIIETDEGPIRRKCKVAWQLQLEYGVQFI